MVEVNDSTVSSLEFHATDKVRWVRLRLDIAGLETEQELLDSLVDRLQEALSAAEGRPVVARVTLTGRGNLCDSLRRPNQVEQLREEVNQDWEGQEPFVWCERIEDKTASPFSREERIAGNDFVAEFLRACNAAKTDQKLQEQLGADLAELFEHWTYRRYLRDLMPKSERLCTLIEEAESIALSLLITDDEV